jgi:uncharacterized protein YgiM (DUF1202 family)
MNRSITRFHRLMGIGVCLLTLLMVVSCTEKKTIQTTPIRSNSPMLPSMTPSPRLPTAQAPIVQATNAPTRTPALSHTPSFIASPFPTTPAMTATPSATPTAPRPDAEIAVEYLRMRDGPGLQYSILQAYPQGTPLDVMGQAPDVEGKPWLLVRANDGSIGWVSARPSLEETQFVSINLPLPQIELRPTPTPYARIEMFWQDEPEGVGGSTLYSSPLSTIRLSSVTTVSCSELCQNENTIADYVFPENVCIQWFERGDLRLEEIEIMVFLDGQEQPLASAMLSGYGGSVCRAVRVRLNATGSYTAHLCHEGYCTSVTWSVR